VSGDRHPFVSALVGAAVLLAPAAGSVALSKTDLCAGTDRAVAGRLAPLLDRRDADDARRSGRAVLTLNRAREYCRFGWTEAALEVYAGLAQAIDAYQRTGHWPDD
jgi:hypothetical protein